MARDGLLPSVFASVHPRFKTPHVTTILTGVAVVFPAGRFVLAVCRLANAGSGSLSFVWIHAQRRRAEIGAAVAHARGAEVRGDLFHAGGGGTLRDSARRRAAR